MSTWDLDPAHSQIEFAVKHMMVTTVRASSASSPWRWTSTKPTRSARP